ncbi:hypothetical protein PIB30_089914 [Stylosanthes scabra]|uniref:Uncharacterized protein n=1 Tax=Stylosanthes scabra TaxID=79078 RepID=A0ABU6TUP4_9FABA|nr:hypothetical protein [Stylosanthes scabra]
MMELVDCFNTQDNSMKTTVGRITLDAPKIGRALGLNARGHTYEKKIDNKKLTDEQKAAVKSLKGDTLKKRLKLEKKDSSMEDPPKEKKTLRKRKHFEEDVSPESEFEDESEAVSSESEPDSERRISQDEK